MKPLLSAEVIHPSHFLFIIFQLTLCKLSEQDISSLFFTFSPSISFCLRLFKFLSTVDVFVPRGGGEEPGAADVQFWVLLARVILSHAGPLINRAFVEASLRSGLRC